MGRYSFVHKNLLDVQAALSELPWILKFHAALFKALEKHGATIGFVQGKELYERSVEARLNGERIRFEFRDGYRRIRIDELELEARKKAGEYPGSYDYPPSGVGTFFVYGIDPKSEEEWKGTREALEAKLGHIAQRCLQILRAQPDQREQRRLARIEASKREQVEARKREVESSRREQLEAAFELSEKFSALARLKEYLTEVERWIPTLNAPYENRGKIWLQIVREELEKNDPLQAWGNRRRPASLPNR